MNAETAVLCVVLFGLGLLLAISVFKVHRLRNINTFHVLFWSHVFVIVLPAYFIQRDPLMIAGNDFLLAACLGTFLLPIGGLIGYAAVPVNKGRRSSFFRAPLSTDVLSKRHTVSAMFVLLAICMVSIAFQYQSSGAYSLKSLFIDQVDVSIIKEIRSQVASEGNFITVISRYCIAPILASCALITWNYRTFFGYRAFCLFCLVIAFLNNSWAGRKTPVVLMFIVAIIAFSLLRENSIGNQTKIFFKYLKTKFIVISLILAIFAYPIIVFIYLPYGSNRDLFEIFSDAVLGRLFYKPALNAYWIFEIFPGRMDFTYFADINSIAQLFNLDYVPISKLVAYYSLGTWTNSTPPSVGIYYAQAGWVGVIFSSIVVGMTFVIVENLLVRSLDKTVISVSIYACLVLGAFRVSWGQFHSVLFSEYIVPIFMIIALFSMLFPKSIRFYGRRAHV